MKTFKSLLEHVVLQKCCMFGVTYGLSQTSQDVRVGQTYETIHQRKLNVLRLTWTHICPPGCAHFKG